MNVRVAPKRYSCLSPLQSPVRSHLLRGSLVRPSQAPQGAQGALASFRAIAGGIALRAVGGRGNREADLGNADVVEQLVTELRAGVTVDAGRLADEQPRAALGRSGELRGVSSLGPRTCRSANRR